MEKNRTNISIFFLFLLTTIQGAETVDARADKLPNSIYLVNHGWHAGIVLHQANIPSRVSLGQNERSRLKYVEIGWGEINFYQNPEPTLSSILNAALVPTASVLHVVEFNTPVNRYFPSAEIVQLKLSAAAITRLTESIASDFAVDKTGNYIALGDGLYGNSTFYRSRRDYHLFNNCNHWVARMLKNAGLPFEPVNTSTVSDLMRQALESGSVVEEEIN